MATQGNSLVQRASLIISHADRRDHVPSCIYRGARIGGCLQAQWAGHALNDEMTTAGARIFVGGLRPPSSARSLRAQPDGEILIGDGPYLETKEQVGGLWVLEAADLEEALTAASAIGDDRLQREAGRSVVPDSFTHGTAEQREYWLAHGYQTGDPNACDTFGRLEDGTL